MTQLTFHSGKSLVFRNGITVAGTDFLNLCVCRDDVLGGREGGNRERRLERLDSQTTEDTVGEENAEGKRGRKRNRQHKKWDWEAAIKNLQLRVMPKSAPHTSLKPCSQKHQPIQLCSCCIFYQEGVVRDERDIPGHAEREGAGNEAEVE